MKLSERSYPYPVLGNRDDMPEHDIQVTPDVEHDSDAYYLSAEFLCSAKTLTDLILAKQAEYVMHVECGATFFRQRFSSFTGKVRATIPAESLLGRVEINFFVCSTSSLDEYSPLEAHGDYSGYAFRIERGDILAIADSFHFDAILSYDNLTNISSIMQIVPSDSVERGRIECEFENPKILIYLHPDTFYYYNVLKDQDQYKQFLALSIVLPVLATALNLTKESPDEYSCFKWCQVIERRLDGQELGDAQHNLGIAQELLKAPLARALRAAEDFEAKTDSEEY